MKVKTHCLSFFVSLAIVSFGCSASLPKGELDIPSEVKYIGSEPDLASHQPFDVEVNKAILPMGNGYSITFYQNENGQLNSHTAHWGPEEDFDKATYVWLNDTTVSIKLFNEASQNEVNFKVFGYGSRIGMSDD